MRATALGLSLLTLAVASLALAQVESRRGVPSEIRRSLVGCWTPWPGERWIIEEHGATGLIARVRFPRAEREALEARFPIRGSARSYDQELAYLPDDGVVQIACGPTTQHGQFCLLRRTDDGLEARVYARGWGRHRHRGRLVDTVTASRCASPNTAPEETSSRGSPRAR